VIDTISNAGPYQQVFERIRAEFLEMPGMRLTAKQVERLAGVDRSICQSVLDDLVRAGFLSTWENGRYGSCLMSSTELAPHKRTVGSHQASFRCPAA
jgi:Fic family protein